ncbi:NADH dehydrogenase [ubiquinone] 1 alpha subcomplex assembly factor 2 isoform X1 [Podarcis muralis]
MTFKRFLDGSRLSTVTCLNPVSVGKRTRENRACALFFHRHERRLAALALAEAPGFGASERVCRRRPPGQQVLPCPEARNLGQLIKERRFVETSGIKEHQYEAGDIPTEWEAWIRKKRKDPPTFEEILKNVDYKEGIKKKIEDIYEKERLLQAKEYEEGLVAEPLQTQIKGHASAPQFGKNEPSEDPVSTANTFQPGSWMPPKDSIRNK